MSSLDNLNIRLNYRGGAKQIDRMNADKLQSLRKALLSSYQAATAVLRDGREFRCLINPNKLTMEIDDKILSIPFNDICLTSNENEVIGVKPGDVITWKENDTHWLIYSHLLQETAYFRGGMRQCDTSIEINGINYWIYIKGPDAKSIDWQNKGFFYNDLNYTLEMYISNDQNTNEFFHRFTKLKLFGKSWQVEAVDNISTEGIIAVYLKEDFTNEFEEIKQPIIEPEQPDYIPRIDGPQKVYPFEKYTYTRVGLNDGTWSLSNQCAKILSQSGNNIEIEIITGRSGTVNLIHTFGREVITYPITILSI